MHRDFGHDARRVRQVFAYLDNADSAEIDNASSRLKTVFELDRPVTSREVHMRCVKYLNAVCEEIEQE